MKAITWRKNMMYYLRGEKRSTTTKKKLVEAKDSKKIIVRFKLLLKTFWRAVIECTKQQKKSCRKYSDTCKLEKPPDRQCSPDKNS
jgi:hypothetical protein